MKSRFKLHTLSASLLACGMVLSSQAQATPITPAHPFPGAYSFAANEITDGLLTVTGGVATLGVSSSQTSTSGTPLPIYLASDSAVGPLPDPLPSTQGSVARLNEVVGGSPATTGTSYTQWGTTVTNYSWADARIVSEQTDDTSVNARNAAEGYITSNGNATSQASNGSTSVVVFTAPGTIEFSFSANPYMEINLGPEAVFPLSKAEANLDLNVSIRDASTGALMFSWSPDGEINTIGGAVGGTELFDTQDLNGSIGTIIPGGSGHYSDDGGLFTSFSAISNVFAVGVYELTLSMNESQNVRLALPVPEPATLALLGLGLIGMAFPAKRRKQA